MQCPACHNDTSDHLTRCTRCGASLTAAPAPPPDTPPWQPVAPRPQRAYLLTGLIAAVLVICVAAGGYLLWQKDSAPGQVPINTRPNESVSEEDPVPAGETTSSDQNGATQAAAVDSLLDEMAASRGQVTKVTFGCARVVADVSLLRTAISDRQTQLTEAESLEVDAIDGGAELKDAIRTALQTSITYSRAAVDWLAADCGPGFSSALTTESVAVTQAKVALVTLWRPIAAQYGLAQRDSDGL
jgi:hypothetical protein